MSAYGAISVPNGPVDLLPPTTWDLPQPSPGKRAAPFRSLVLHHLRLESARALPAGSSLLEYTYRIFAAEVEAGRTYPQEAEATSSSLSSGKESDHDSYLSGGSGGDTHIHATQAVYTRAAFEACFWAADVIIAIGQMDNDHGQAQVPNVGSGSASAGDLLEISRGVEGRSWEDALVGFYFVKPNYPGRSSHVSCVYCKFLSTILHYSFDLFFTRRIRSVIHDAWVGYYYRLAMRVSLSPLPTGNSDMERLWASRICTMVLHSDTKQAFSI